MITFYVHRIWKTCIFPGFGFFFLLFVSIWYVACHENADRPSIFIEHLIKCDNGKCRWHSLLSTKMRRRIRGRKKKSIAICIRAVFRFERILASKIPPFHFMTMNWKCLKIAQFICTCYHISFCIDSITLRCGAMRW